MVRSIVIVAALLIFVLYSAAFFMWNADTTTNVVTLHLFGTPWWIPEVPVGFLPIIGAAIGAVIMAIAAWFPWAGQRKAAQVAEAKMKKAIERFKKQKKRIEAQNDRIEELQEDIAELEQQGMQPPEGKADEQRQAIQAEAGELENEDAAPQSDNEQSDT